MESWVLEGDSYSFLHSSPPNFSLRHRDGPNRVEIFDITSIPSSRSVISETTCLCDIFGDDGESTLSSSPASTSFLKRDVDAHVPAEEVNDSSGSYHTAQSSEQMSDTSDTFEDSKDTDSLKHPKDVLSPDNAELSSPPKEFTSSNDRTVIASENGSLTPTPTEDSGLSQTEYQKTFHASQDTIPIQTAENIDSSAQPLVMSTAEFRDTNVRVSDSLKDTGSSGPLSETRYISEPSNTASFELRDISTAHKQRESSFSENQGNHVQTDTASKLSAEDNNVLSYPEGQEAEISDVQDIRINHWSSKEDIQEAVRTDVSTDLNLSHGDCDCTPTTSCPSTNNTSRALTPMSTSPEQAETNICSDSDVTSEPKVLESSSPERMRLPSTLLDEDAAWLPEEPRTVPSPTLSAEGNTESNISPEPQHPALSAEDNPEMSICQHPNISLETSELVASPDMRRSSFLSDTSETLQSPEVSEFCSFSDSPVAATSSEPSVVIHTPVGYSISPSPEFERKVCSTEPEVLSSTSKVTEMDYPVTPTGFQSSVSSPDSKLCLTPESRSITSTPEIRQDFLTPNSVASALSPELRSATCSPEIRTITCSIQAQNSNSPQVQGVEHRAAFPLVLEQYPNVQEVMYAESSSPTTQLTNEIKDLASSPISGISSEPEGKFRPLSATVSMPRDASPSSEIRHQMSPDGFSDHTSVPDPCIPVDEEDSHHLTSEEMDLPLLGPADRGQFNDYEELPKSSSPALEDPVALSQTRSLNNSVFDQGDKFSVMKTEECEEKMNENLWTVSNTTTAPIAEESDDIKGNDSCGKTEMLEKESAGSEKPHGHLPVRPRESPTVFHSDNQRWNDSEPCRNKGWSEDRVVQEEHESEKEAEDIVEGSYRGEQVELSFRARNRKGPASHSTAPSSGDPKSGIQARRYFESPLTTRQQQSLLRAQGSQKENKSGARRVQLAFQSKHSGAIRLPSGCTSETSSMGSEFDEADNEVKWFTDLAFRSLSSPQGDYLDVYSSSHRSSTNVSRPSTVDSPGASTWMSYAELRGSKLHENDDLPCHVSSFLPHGSLDPSKRFEMGNFECVDVAVESKEESKRGKRTVPKRQIQLKRRDPDESKSVENAVNVMDSPATQRRPRDTLFCQHSTPAAVQENVFGDQSEIHTERKMLQKSASLDESTPQTKMASCIIKSVLSKKMETKESSRSPSEDKKEQPETLFAGPSHIERHSLSSSVPFEGSLSSDDFVGKEEKSPLLQKKTCGPKVPPKPFFKAGFIPAYNNPGIAELPLKVPVSDHGKPSMEYPFADKTPKKQMIKNKEVDTSGLREKFSNNLANTITRSTSSSATRATRAHGRTTYRDLDDQALSESCKPQDSRRTFLSQTPEITLKPSAVKDKKKSSLKVSLSPDHTTSDFPLAETLERQQRFNREEDEENGVVKKDHEKIQPKQVIHKVRDVRKLVKNTYNLSFKATTTTETEDADSQNYKEMPPQNPHALHIECKAISWKNKQASENKKLEEASTAEESEMNKDKNISETTDKHSLPRNKLDTNQSISTSSNNCEQSTDLEVPPRPTSKEISALVFLQDATSKSVQSPVCPASPDGKTKSSSHSVSMLLKEKGMQADIGVCDIVNEGGGTTPKLINTLEIPLQTCVPDGTLKVSQKMQKEDKDLPAERKTPTDRTPQANHCVSLLRSSPMPKEVRVSPSIMSLDNQSQAASLQSSKDEKTTTHSTSVAKVSAPLATSNKAEVRSFSSNTKSHAMSVATSKEIELPIQVRSISSDRPKPSVPPKPSYKQPFTETRSMSSEHSKTDITPTSFIFKQQTHLKSDAETNETSAAVPHKEQTTDAPSNTKQFAVLAVSSYKPSSVPVTTVSGSMQKSTTSVSTGKQQVSTTSLQSPVNQQLAISQDQVMPDSSCATSQHISAAASQGHVYKQPTKTPSFNNQLHKDDFLFQASDDPPSYDERESFSPLLLSDLPPRRVNRYHPTNKHSPCSCSTASHPHLGHPYHGSQNHTPPIPQSPGQGLSYSGAPPQAQVRPHQSRQDGQPLNYTPIVPKSTVPPAPAMIQPLHHSYPCTAPGTQTYGDEQQPAPSTQQMERHSANRRSPQAASGAAYHEHSRSPNISLDPRSQFFSAHDLPPAFAHEYGSDGTGGGSVLYPENASGLGYGQGPRRVLLDPETGKYFYIEVPMQPLRKMLFDPELGQYVEVLIPQQAMSHSGMYPPTAAPYPSLHGPGLYAPQYLPYAAPPHPQSAQQPRHPETSVSASLHQSSMGYGSSASQTPKTEAKGHPSVDQSYLESMYYIPTGMNASPNSTASDCYHKRSPNMPVPGGRRA